MAVAEGEYAELAIAGDADEVRSADGVAAPDAEFGVALTAGGGGEGERGDEECGESEELQRAMWRGCRSDRLGGELNIEILRAS